VIKLVLRKAIDKIERGTAVIVVFGFAVDAHRDLLSSAETRCGLSRLTLSDTSRIVQRSITDARSAA
jgi:hypothetical protein